MNLRTFLPVIGLICSTVVSHAATIYGLTSSNQLLKIDPTNPGAAVTIGTISAPGIVDIDFYPGNGLLYGITATGYTYTLNLNTAQATFRFAPSIPLTQISDFDFDPLNARMVLLSLTHLTYSMVPDYVSSIHTGGVAGTVTLTGTYSSSYRIVANAFDDNVDTAAKTEEWFIGDAPASLFVVNGTTTTLLRSLDFSVGMATGFDMGQDGGFYVSNGNNLYNINLYNSFLGTVSGTGLTSIAVQVAPVPEANPSTFMLVGGAALVFLWKPKRRVYHRPTNKDGLNS